MFLLRLTLFKIVQSF